MKSGVIAGLAIVATVACGPSAEQLNQEDAQGFTPLVRSAGRGSVDDARRQIERGALVDLKTKADELTGLRVASYCGHLQMVQLLVEKGATVTDKDVEYAANGGQRSILTYYKATKKMEPPAQSGFGAFLSVGSMPLDKLKSLCGD
jgi:uncharacterized protein